MANGAVTHAWTELTPTHIFSWHSPLTLRNTGQLLSATLKGPFEMAKSPRKSKNVKNVAVNKTYRDRLFVRWELKQESRESPQPGTCISGNSHFLPLCTCPWRTAKEPQGFVFGSHIRFSEGVNSHAWILRIVRTGLTYHFWCSLFLSILFSFYLVSLIFRLKKLL